MPSPVHYNPRRELGLQWSIDYVYVGGQRKRRIRAKGYSSNRTTIIGDSMIQMLSDLLFTSIQSVPGAYARDLVDMCTDGTFTVADFSVVAIMAGTNDVSSKKGILEILVSFRRLIHKIRLINPTCKIAICEILRRPCDEKSEAKKIKLENFNKALKADCELTNVYFIPTSKSLKDMGPDTLLFRHDGIHLTFDGVGCLKMYMEGLLGSIMGMPPQWDPTSRCVLPKSNHSVKSACLK
jgi:hypothetical protein